MHECTPDVIYNVQIGASIDEGHDGIRHVHTSGIQKRPGAMSISSVFVVA